MIFGLPVKLFVAGIVWGIGMFLMLLLRERIFIRGIVPCLLACSGSALGCCGICVVKNDALVAKTKSG